MPRQRRLDLAGLDAEAAHLDLRIRPSEEVEHAVGPPARQVAGAVHAAARRPERIGHEPFRRQGGTPEIAARQSGARDVELARDTGRHRLQSVVQHVNPKVGNPATNETAGVCRDHGLVERDVGDMHRRFGDAVHISKERGVAGVAQVPLVESAELQRFAAEDHVAQCEGSSELGVLQLRLHQLVERGRSSD